MTKKTINGIVSSANKNVRRKLINKEIKLLGIITGIWLAIILTDIIVNSVTGNSLIMGLFELEGRRARRTGPAYALLLLFGPPIFVAFRIFLFPLTLANRINRELLSAHQISEGDFSASQRLIRSRVGLIILAILLAILGLIIVIGIV